MRNGIRFSNLTLTNSTGKDADEVTGDELRPSAVADETAHAHRIFLVFLSISVTCAAATIATGTYAAWLSRQQAAQQALTDVNDILKSCQSRMSQLEADLQRLPTRQI